MKRIVFALALLAALAPPLGADEFPMYLACSAAQAVTAATDMLHLEAGPDKGVLVWKVWVVPGTQTTAGYHQVVLRRTTSASTGGSTVTASPLSSFGAAFTGIVRYGATGGGANGVTLTNGAYFVATTSVSGGQDYVLFNATGPGGVPIQIAPNGTTGLELNNATGGAGGANHYACVQFSEMRQ